MDRRSTLWHLFCLRSDCRHHLDTHHPEPHVARAQWVVCWAFGVSVRDARGRGTRRRDRFVLAVGRSGGFANCERAPRFPITRVRSCHGYFLSGSNSRLVAAKLVRQVLTLDIRDSACVK